jgi:hypothetical protein
MIEATVQKVQLSEEKLTERMNENPTKNRNPRIRKANLSKILKIQNEFKSKKNPESLINQYLSV